MSNFLEPVVGRLVGDNSNYIASLNDAERRTGGYADASSGHFSRLGSNISKFAKVAAVGLTGAVAGLGVFLKKSFDAAEESRKVAAQTAAVVKSTGGVANVSAEGVARYADKLAALTGIDDEVIAGGQNMLLTFTQVRNEAGKGNDIFNQGTKAALNMSVALGQDLQSSSMLVGKALNDPIKGVTALTRSGIQFTDQQKAQIKAMTESGNVLGAQKIILKELETQFGGSAEAAASPLARLKVVVGNLQEELGARLLPVVGKVATFLAGALPRALDAVGRALSPILGGIRAFAAAWKAADGDVTSSGFAGTMERLANAARPVFVEIIGGIRAFVAAFKAGGDDITSSGVAGKFEAVGLRVRAAVDAVVDWVREHWPEIRKIISDTLKTVQQVVRGAVDLLQTVWENFGDQIIDVAKAAWRFVRDTIEGALRVIQGIVKVITGIIHGDWGQVWEGIKEIVSGAWEVIKARIDLALNIVKNIISVAMEIVKATFREAWDVVKGIFGAAWDGIFEVARKGVANVVDLFLGMVGTIIHAADSAFGWIPGIGDKLHDARVAFDNFRDDVNRALRGIEDRNVRVTIDHVEYYRTYYGEEARAEGNPGGRQTAYPIGLAMGPVPGPRGQAVRITAHGGEWVLTPEQYARMQGGVSAGSAGYGGAGGLGGGAGMNVNIAITTATGDIPDETIRKIRSALESLAFDLPGANIFPGAA